MDALEQQIVAQARAAKDASFVLRAMSTEEKNDALSHIAAGLRKRAQEILAVNAQEVADVGAVSDAFLSRLTLTPEKIGGMVEQIEAVIALPDPVGEIVKQETRPNGLVLRKVRIPIGVICCIYESRPNVTLDIAVLSLKSGNACILRGGKEVLRTNALLARIIHEALAQTTIPTDAVQLITERDHRAVSILAGLSEYVDLIIPRGGERLIDTVATHARMPVLQHRKGVTHVFVDKQADVSMAVDIIDNGKTSNPSVCNSLEKVLVDAHSAPRVLPAIVARLHKKNVEVRGCARAQRYAPTIVAATEADWDEEYLDRIIAIKVVDGIDAAIAHIQRHSTGLADAIVTNSDEHAKQFLAAIDSAATYVNASTRFTDGGEFGLGAEVGISTAKIHGMGPMGLEDLTVTKYIGIGQGHVRT